jgi:hypothetical protein
MAIAYKGACKHAPYEFGAPLPTPNPFNHNSLRHNELVCMHGIY